MQFQQARYQQDQEPRDESVSVLQALQRQEDSAGNVTITVRVTRPEQIGLYQRLVTQTGRRLPKVTQRCVSTTGQVRACP